MPLVSAPSVLHCISPSKLSQISKCELRETKKKLDLTLNSNLHVIFQA